MTPISPPSPAKATEPPTLEIADANQPAAALRNRPLFVASQRVRTAFGRALQNSVIAIRRRVGSRHCAQHDAHQ